MRGTMSTANSLPLEPSYDIREALSRVLGDRHLLEELIDIVRAESPQLFAEIRRCVEVQDLRGLERAAHRLRGSVTVFGARAVAQAALALELMGRDHALVDASSRILELDRELRRLDRELSNLRVQSTQ
jgi:two-component system, sensor histidine kinase and response regulator